MEHASRSAQLWRVLLFKNRSEPVFPLVLSNAAATGVTLAESAGANPGEFLFTADASGGTAPYEYRFALRDPVSGIWNEQQAYSNSNTWTFDTNGQPAGLYRIWVTARSAGSLAFKEAGNTVNHTVGAGVLPATAVSLAESAGANPGELLYTAAASGGTAPYEYRFLVKELATGIWTVPQTYTTTDNWTFNTNGLSPGSYRIRVDARSVGSTAGLDTTNSLLTAIP